MRMSDFDSAKKLSQEIERIKLEDIATIERRSKELIHNLISGFKEKQARDMQ